MSLFEILNLVGAEPVGFSFPLCGFDRVYWNATEVMNSLQRQVLYFARYIKYSKVLAVLKNYWQMAMIEIIKDVDGAGRRHMVISISAPKTFSFGYVYIHEDALSDGQAKARGHHHWRFIKEGSSMLRSCVKEIMDTEATHKREPQQKTRRIAQDAQHEYTL